MTFKCFSLSIAIVWSVKDCKGVAGKAGAGEVLLTLDDRDNFDTEIINFLSELSAERNTSSLTVYSCALIQS
jgi:hypothetical protein